MDHPDVDARAIEEALLALRAIELEDQARELVATLAPADPTYPRQAAGVLHELESTYALLAAAMPAGAARPSPRALEALVHIAGLQTQIRTELRQYHSRAAGWAPWAASLAQRKKE